jgi:hypothetical protein
MKFRSLPERSPIVTFDTISSSSEMDSPQHTLCPAPVVANPALPFLFPSPERLVLSSYYLCLLAVIYIMRRYSRFLSLSVGTFRCPSSLSLTIFLQCLVLVRIRGRPRNVNMGMH